MVLENIGVSSIDKVELATYQLIDVGKIRYAQWKDSRLIREGPIEWKAFK